MIHFKGPLKFKFRALAGDRVKLGLPFDGATAGIGIVDPISLDHRPPSLVEFRRVIGGVYAGGLHCFANSVEERARQRATTHEMVRQACSTAPKPCASAHFYFS